LFGDINQDFIGKSGVIFMDPSKRKILGTLGFPSSQHSFCKRKNNVFVEFCVLAGVGSNVDIALSAVIITLSCHDLLSQTTFGWIF
jgi:hypothetical protein